MYFLRGAKHKVEGPCSVDDHAGGDSAASHLVQGRAAFTANPLRTAPIPTTGSKRLVKFSP